MDSKQVGVFVTPWGATISAVYRPSTVDWNTLTSTIVEDEYRIASLLPNAGWCVDIGGHVGGCTLGLLSRGFHVVTVEPLPENMDMIAESVGLNGWDARWRSVHGAIADVRGKTATVMYGDTTTESGAHHEFIGVTTGIYTRAAGCRTVDVRTVSIGELVEMCDDRAGWIEAPMQPPHSDGAIEFMKSDCEGAEWAAFQNTEPYTLGKVKAIAAELHPLEGMTDPRGEFTKLLHGRFDDISVQIYGQQSAAPAPTLAYYRQK